MRRWKHLAQELSGEKKWHNGEIKTKRVLGGKEGIRGGGAR